MSGLLRLATAGSVDDGKSSLIGRLLYDSKSIMEDQMRSIERASRSRGSDGLELALLTDGLRAEREQNITIDVAYRYFSTVKRKFIVADTPGHLQYTRNMVTGTSTADLSVVLVDARKGVLSQSRRHVAISSLLGIRQIVVAVNKMDLVGFSEDVFREIEREMRDFTERLGVPRVEFIPISALLGDNVVERSSNMSWYEGRPMLEFLEQVEIPERAVSGFRLPVQLVIRPHQDYRGFAGRVESGAIRVGDPVGVAISGLTSRVASIHVAGEVAQAATAGQAAVIELEHEIDASRGDMLVSPANPPARTDRFEAVVCWLGDRPLKTGRNYAILHTTRRVAVIVERLVSQIDVDTLEPRPANELNTNDLGRVVLRSASPLFVDPYDENPSTGSFVLVDPGTNATVAAGMIEQSFGDRVLGSEANRTISFAGTAEEAHGLAKELRETYGHSVLVLDASHAEAGRQAAAQGFVVLFTGGVVPGALVGDREDLWRTLRYSEGDGDGI
jgi:bifunctional enzyme CysN/CysC